MGNEAPDRLRVLLVRVGAMGDVLHALPAVAALRERVPGCIIGWAIEPVWCPLLVGRDGKMPLVNRVHAVATRTWKRRPFSLETIADIARLRLELKSAHYDVCVDLQGSIRSAVIGKIAGAKRLVGIDEPRERQARILYGEQVAVRSEHVIGQGCELLGAAVGIELTPGKVLLPDDADDDGRGYVLLAPTAGWGAKMWPVERYRELAERLRRMSYRVVVNAASSNDMVAKKVGVEVRVCGVEELAGVVRRAALVIGGDTGPVQMAGALGVPAVALFGPTDPARTGPQGFVGSRVTVLRDESSVVDHRRHAETEAGLKRIGVEMVFEAAMARLGVSAG